MRLKEKEDLRPGIVKFGVAVALSLGGILYYYLRDKRVRPLDSPTSPHSSGISYTFMCIFLFFNFLVSLYVLMLDDYVMLIQMMTMEPGLKGKGMRWCM